MATTPYSGEIKNDFCRRLLDDWHNLANYLEIPPDRKQQFEQGREAQGIWEWLEIRKRLSELPNALVKIHREDLADLLKERKQRQDFSALRSSDRPVEQEPNTSGPSRKIIVEPPVDFIIVTPLAEERDAVLDQLGNYRRIPTSEQDIRVYFGADLPVTFPDGSEASYRIVVMPLLDMGRVEAANATADAIRRWQPRYVLLVGIAGGLAKAEVKLGDVLIADQVADYELQKLEQDKTKIRWQVHRTDARLRGEAQNLLSNVWLKRIRAKRPGEGKPGMHIGPICTGDKVIANELAESYRDIWTKLIGVEMEAGGVASAAFQAPSKPAFFMIRGVSDLADSAKNSAEVHIWRAYACDVAAAFTIALLENGAVPARPR